MFSLLKVLFQYILPKLWINRLIGWFANKQAGWLTKLTIDIFVRYFKIDMKEARCSDTASYRSLNEFFVRPLRDNVRPLNTDHNILVMPADGVISQFGEIKGNKILQIKNHFYTLESLLADDQFIAEQFRNGIFVTTYLSPRDCHRVYMPCDGILSEMIYVPGKLFSVDHQSTKYIPNLFARNERVICLFDTKFDLLAQILVGAIAVGGIETAWISTTKPPRKFGIKRWKWPIDNKVNSIKLSKGQEMGRFKFGSTVINLFSPGRVCLVKTLKILSVARIGQPLAISTRNFYQIN